MSFLTELEPRTLWSHFDDILKIPRASKDEGRVRDHIVALADKHGLEYRVDEAGNLVVRKPGASGRESAPVTVLQAHLDMVQEKNSDTKFDFSRDPIVPRREGEYVKATGTTLGSDNGIGVASMMALIDAQDVAHGPLELLFTVDEETGLTGATELAEGLLEGRRLINVDSEEEGVLTIGCAGGADSHLALPLEDDSAPADGTAWQVRLFGLKGGHSGIDIHLQRGNAVRLLARALLSAAEHNRLLVADLHGGSAHNAIPREAEAVVVTVGDDASAVRDRLRSVFEEIAAELGAVEPDLAWSIEKNRMPERSWSERSTKRALRLLVALPHGVEAMSRDIDGLVETSTNEAVVKPVDGKLTILMSTRSSEASASEALRQRIRAIAELAGAVCCEDDGYPGWKPDVDSPLLAIVREVHEKVTGENPEVGAVHAGLECGIIGEKYPGMDMISIGPQIEFPHSPDERVKIDSVGTFYTLLTRTLERLAE